MYGEIGDYNAQQKQRILPFLMINCLKTTKSKKFTEFYYQFIRIISQLTIEFLEENNIPCDSVNDYLNVGDPNILLPSFDNYAIC